MAESKQKPSGRAFAAGVLLFGLAGYVIGVMTAPKSGKETRKELRGKASLAKVEAEKKLKSLHSELNGMIAAGKQKAGKAKYAAQKELSQALEKANSARQKAREMLSALHEGDADDDDLQKAVKDINNAVENLKKFVNKNARAR